MAITTRAGKGSALTHAETDTNFTDLLEKVGGTMTGLLTIDQNSEAEALRIDSEAATSSAVHIVGPTTTTGTTLQISNADSLTTGSMVLFHSNSADVTGRSLVHFHNENTLAIGAVVLKVQQDAAERCAFLDQNGNDIALEIDSEATTADVINVAGAAVTTGTVLDIGDVNSISTGKLARFHSNSADVGGRFLVFIHNDNTAATAATPLVIQQDAANTALLIDQNGNGKSLEIVSDATTANTVEISAASHTTGHVITCGNANALTTGSIARYISNSANTSARSLVFVHNDNSLATGATTLNVQQDAANQAVILNQTAASSFIDFQGTAAATTTDPISTNTTSGLVTHHLQIEINGVKAWIPASTNNPS
jgi:hypothetical protein